MLKWIMATIVVWSASSLAFAKGLQLNGTLLHFSHGTETEAGNNEIDREMTYQFWTFGGCFMINDQFCFGLKVLSGKQAVESTTYLDGVVTNTSESRVSYTGNGLSLGYYGAEFMALLTYYLDGKRTTDGSVYQGGAAYQGDIGYRMKLGSMLFGPMLSYVNLSYDEVEVSGTTTALENDENDYFIIPSFAFWYEI